MASIIEAGAAGEGNLSENGEEGRVLNSEEMEAIQKTSSAPKTQPKERRADFNKWTKGVFGFYAHNLFMLQYFYTEMGVAQKLYRLIRERCIFFHDAAVAMLYLKINGYVPLSSSSFYELHGLNENVDDGTYKQRFSSVVSSSRQSWRAIRKIPEAIWYKNILPYLCGGSNGYPNTILTDDKFNLKRDNNRLENPLAIFDFPQLDRKVICLDTVTERLRSLSLPNEDSIPRKWNAGLDKSYENKKVTVASFFEKGVSALANSISKRTPFVFMRGLMFFFIFSSLLDRTFPGLVVRNVLRERFHTIARCYTHKQHVLYWVFFAQFLYRMITETASIANEIEQINTEASDEEKTKQLLALLSTMTAGTSMEHTFAIYQSQASLGFEILKKTAMRQLDWAVRVDARLKENINKSQKFDEYKTQFGVQTRKPDMLVFIMALNVSNHPIRRYGMATEIRFGIAMNKNDTSLEGVFGLTLNDVLKQWFQEFWEHPLSYYFQHSIPRPDEDTGLPTFSLTRRFVWQEYGNNGWMSSSRILHAMSLEYLLWYLQGSEYSPKWYCAIEDLSEPAQCCLRIETNSGIGSRYKSERIEVVSYEANLWNILNEKFPLIHANGLRFRFFTSEGSTFVLTPETTVADYAHFCHCYGDFSDLYGCSGLDVSVPSLSHLKVQNPEPFDNSYYGRVGENYKMEDYNLPLKAWLREKFPWLEKENVFHAVKYMNGQPTEETTCIEFVKRCADKEPLITLPNLQDVKVQNSRPFFEINGGGNDFDEEVLEKLPMNTPLKDIVHKIAERHPMLDANEVVLSPPMAITETATLLDWMVLNNERGRVIKFKKITVKLVERQSVESYSNIEDYVKQSAIAMANLLKETLGDRITYRRFSKQDGTYTFKRDYIFVRQDADDLDITCVVALLKLLYVFLYGKKTYEFRMGGQSFLECFEVFQHTFSATTVTEEALNKDKFDALPDYFKARLLSSEIAKKFFGVVLLQQERRDCSDRFFSPFEFALRQVQERTESCDEYFSGTWVEKDSNVKELIVSDDPNVTWSSSYKKCRPQQYLIVRKFSCFPNTLLPHNVLELWSEKEKKEILNAFFLCQAGDYGSVGREEEGGLRMDIFGRGYSYENWPFANLCVSDKEVSEEYDQIRNYAPNVTFSYKNTKGGFKEIAMEKAISYYSKRYRYVGNGKFEENEKTDIICAARGPTVCKPWDMFYYLDKTGAYYKMENAYAEPEVWTEKLTEKQKATLLARAELNRKRTLPKKKRKRSSAGSSAGSSGSPSKRASVPSAASSKADIMNVLDTMISLTKKRMEGVTGEDEELLLKQLTMLEEKKRELLK